MWSVSCGIGVRRDEFEDKFTKIFGSLSPSDTYFFIINGNLCQNIALLSKEDVKFAVPINGHSYAMKQTTLAKWFMAAAVFFAMASCNGTSEEQAEPQRIVRIDEAIASYKDLDSVSRAGLRDSLHDALSAYAQVLRLDTVGDSELLSISESYPVEMFTPEVEKVFLSLDTIESDLGATLAAADKQGLGLPRHTYAAVVWGRPESMLLNGDIMLVALNHYLGASHEAYDHWPEYKRKLKSPEMLVYDIAEAEMGMKYPYSAAQSGATLLSHMLYDGALAYCKKELVPDASEARALGFTDQELADLYSNESFMWGKLVSGQMLHSTDADLIARLTTPAPASPAISPNAPGRAVRFAGYRIVCAYMQRNPETKLSDLLSPTFYNSPDVLTKAAYNPQGK